MAKDVYVAAVGLTKVDLTGRIFGSVFDLFAEAYRKALEDCPVRSFDAVQVGIMDSEEFENRANIATKVADRLGLTGIPAVRSETASSTGAAAFHEAYYKVASGEFETVLVLAGERMKMVTTEVATAIMSKTVDPEERRFGFTMPALIALITQAWMRERDIGGRGVADVLARLMLRAHALGARNPLAAFYGRPEPLSAYFDTSANRPVATPLMRKDCSPICDGAAALVLTARPQAVRVAGLGSATETASILDREELTTLEATRHAARIACWRAGIADLRAQEGLVIEAHDAFNSLLPIDLADLGLVDADEAVEALVGPRSGAPQDPLLHPVTGPRGRMPTNLSGGLKARGHPVGGTGLFQIAECYLQLALRFPVREAQVPDARLGLAHSIGGPGNNNYVTLLERADSRRRRDEVRAPRLHFESRRQRPPRESVAELHGATATVVAATAIHVTASGGPPLHVALLEADGRRLFARLDPATNDAVPSEQDLAGQKVRVQISSDGEQTFQLVARRPGFALGRLVGSLRRKVGAGGE